MLIIKYIITILLINNPLNGFINLQVLKERQDLLSISEYTITKNTVFYDYLKWSILNLTILLL